MDLITDFKQSYERHFGEPAPQVWQRPHKGFTIAYSDGRRATMYKTDMLTQIAAMNGLAELSEELKHD